MLWAYPEHEIWSTPSAVFRELQKQGVESRKYSLFDRTDDEWAYGHSGITQLRNDLENGYAPDFVLLSDYGQFRSPLLTRGLHPQAVWVLEAGDDPQQFANNHVLCRGFDLVFTPDRQCVPLYEQAGKRAFWWTQHADTELYRADYESKCLVATTCGDRHAVLAAAKEALGEDFQNLRTRPGEPHARALGSGSMVVHKSQFGEIGRRIFEGMACGRLVFADRLDAAKGLESIFTDGHDIVLYEDGPDLIDKIGYFAEHTDKRDAIARRGHARVMKEHSTAARVAELLSTLRSTLEDRLRGAG